MAEITYNIFTGELVVLSEKNKGTMVTAFAESGDSNLWLDSGKSQVKKHGKGGHIDGGPIPEGKWRVGPPGSKHPDGGRLRPGWIPVGPIPNRTFVYIHHQKRTEGCINIPKYQPGNDETWRQILKIVRAEQGGWLMVTRGDVPEKVVEERKKTA